LCSADNSMARLFQQGIYKYIDFDRCSSKYVEMYMLWSNNNHSHNLDQKCLADNSMVQQYQQDIALLKFFRMIKEY
jgi:hypothetical protein